MLQNCLALRLFMLVPLLPSIGCTAWLWKHATPEKLPVTSSFSELWTPVDESRPELLVLQAGRSRQPVRYEVIVRVAPSEGGTVTVKPSAFDAKEIQRLALLRLQAGYAQTADIAVVIDAARPEGYKTASVQCRILEINPDYMVIVFQDPEAVRRLGPIEPADESGYVLVRPMRVRDEHPVWRAVITPVEVTTPWRDRLANRLTLVAGTPLTLIADVGYLVTSPIWLPLLVHDVFSGNDPPAAPREEKHTQYQVWHPPLAVPAEGH